MSNDFADGIILGSRNSLDTFVTSAFGIVNPGTLYKWNWHIHCIAEFLESAYRGEIKRLIFNMPPRELKSFLISTCFPAWVLGREPHERFIVASHSLRPLAAKLSSDTGRLMRSDFYQEVFSDTILEKDTEFELRTTKNGHRVATAQTGVIGLGGNYLILDDPNKPDEALSDGIRKGTNEWIDNTFMSRMDDRTTGRLILVQQRVHENDVTGHLLDKGGYTLVKLPAEAHKKIILSVNGYDYTMEKGDLLQEDRLPAEELVKLQNDLGSYSYCTPYDAPILMADLSMKKIGEIKPNDVVMGFTTEIEKNKRSRLCESRVQKVTVSKRPVIKVTLNSGEVIRCTEDHRWFNGRGQGDKNRPRYDVAKVGRKLMRICPPSIDKLTTEEDLRLAGWLAGFFDGEGSAVIQKGRCAISFAQGAGRNLPLCHELERALTHFGFTFNYTEHIREDRKYNRDSCHLSRWYWLTGNVLPKCQKMLHVIKPLKWRQRMIDGSKLTRFIIGEEKIVSIEQDGIETVYGLTTETGNYVVYGLASKNCGQYLQEPAPPGGGLFKQSWIKYYDQETFNFTNANGFILCDPAGVGNGGQGNAKRKKSDWTAFMVVALAEDQNYYLVDIVRDKFNPTERIAALFDLHRQWTPHFGKPLRVGYESYGLQSDLHYIEAKQKEESYNFQLIPLGGRMAKEDRIARLIPDMENQRWLFPRKIVYKDSSHRTFDLVDEMIKGELMTFPVSKFDDCIDALSRTYDEDMYARFPAMHKKKDLVGSEYMEGLHNKDNHWITA